MRTSRPIFIALIILLVLPLAALCVEMPSDVHEDNPYYDYVQDLVDRDIYVSQGYPDGTFHGDKYTTNYQAAYLMSKLALNLVGTGTTEIDVSDLEDEIAWLRRDIRDINNATIEAGDFRFSGIAELKSQFGSVAAYNAQKRAELGPETDYRLRYTIYKSMGRDANLKMNLDTMDGATTQRTFPSKMIDIEGNLTTDIGIENPMWMKVTSGPGAVFHRDTSGVAPSDDYTVYDRPKNTLTVGTKIGSYEISSGYVARCVRSDGTVGTSEMNFSLGRDIGQLLFLGEAKSVLTTRYVFTDFMDPTSGPNDFRYELKTDFISSRAMSGSFTLGASSLNVSAAQYYFGLLLNIADPNNTFAYTKFTVDSAGVDYRLPFEELEFLPLNMFNKKILDGMNDVGLEISQPLSPRLSMKNKVDWTGSYKWKVSAKDPGTSITDELGFYYNFNPDLILDVFYRYYFVPSEVSQFGVTVPEYSDLLGFGLNFRF
jgi:hypothetical protein